MNDMMTNDEKHMTLALVLLFLVLLTLTLYGIYDATIVFEDGSFIMPNGWSGCVPWGACWQ
jgi:hypothetical protein